MGACCSAPPRVVPADQGSSEAEEEERRKRRSKCHESLNANGGRLFVSGVIQRANRRNRNGRVYPRDVLFRETEKFRLAYVETNKALGELDHPNPTSPTFRCLSYNNVSHQVLEYHWEGDDLVGAVEVLPTPAGRMLLDLYLAGYKLGVSSRGWATLKKVENVEYIQDDFELVTFDFVSDPSTSGAYLDPVEGKYKPPVDPDLAKVLRKCGQKRVVGFFDRDRVHYPDDDDEPKGRNGVATVVAAAVDVAR